MAIQHAVKNGCDLPCILGLEPEQAQLSQVLTFLDLQNNEAMKNEYTLDYSYQNSDVSSDNHLLSILFHMNDNQLHSITVYMEKPNDWLPMNTYHLQDILLSFQSTPEVYVAIKENLHEFFFVIVYNSEGVMADYQYYFEDEEFEPSSTKRIILCPKVERNNSLVLWLQGKNNKKPIEDRIYPQMPSGSLRKDNFYRPIEQVMELTASEFVKQIKSNPDGCFQALSYDQLRRAGQEF